MCYIVDVEMCVRENEAYMHDMRMIIMINVMIMMVVIIITRVSSQHTYHDSSFKMSIHIF